MTTAELHVSNVLSSHQSESNMYVASYIIETLRSSITTWANGHLLSIQPAGSIAKGTAISESSDVDILVSVRETAVETLKEVYDKLFNRLEADGFSPRRQNVSLGLVINGWKVDVVPAKRHSSSTTNHSLWSHKSKTHRETDINKHIKYVRESNRIDEIRLTKIWRKLNGLEFPSFPLEVTVIEALKGHGADLADNFVTVLRYFENSITSARITDPTKPSNVLSDELTNNEKSRLAAAANDALGKEWGQVIW